MKGVKIATANCGIKYKNRDDLLLVVFEDGASVAGVFSKTSMPAAPLSLSKKNLSNKRAKALLVNAGNANAFTGGEGEKIVVNNSQKLSEILTCDPKEIFISSTGVIGELFDYNKINNQLDKMHLNLSEESSYFDLAAKAIMTTDTRSKKVSATCNILGQKVEIAGIAKGSGMIAPNMATMLSYFFTDANISSSALQEILNETVDISFNSITVDNDTSTNDTLMIFASGASGHDQIVDADSVELLEFRKTLTDLAISLAKQIVIDGEGAKKLIEVQIHAALSKSQAKEVALSIANSPLVKTAIAGADPNWGRIIMAIGKSCPEASPKKISLKIGNFQIIENGNLNKNYKEKDVHQYLKESTEVIIEVNLGLGKDIATIWGCDLNEEYIHINKDYRS